jgi:hypothetical protein
MQQINSIFNSPATKTEHPEILAPLFGWIRRVRSISHKDLGRGFGIAIATGMVGALIGCAGTSGVAARDTQPDSERVRYITATLALEQGDERLGVQMLEELADDTGNNRAHSLYRALIASTERNLDRVDEILRDLPPPPPDETGDGYAWIETPLALLAAERELDRVRRENDSRLDDILSQHYKARGGLEKLQSLTDLLVIGRLVVNGQELPIQLARKRERFYRFDLEMKGGLRVEAFDGDVAWGFDAPRGDTIAAYLQEPRATEIKRMSFFDEVLVRFEKTGHELFLKTIETVDDRDYYPIDVSEDGRLVETIYLDGETFLEGRRLVWDAHGSLLAERIFEHKSVDGISFPAQQTISIGASTVTYHYDEYALDVDIPVRVFVLSEFNEDLAKNTEIGA